MGGKSWTKEEVKLLRELTIEGTTVKEMIPYLKRSEKSIWDKKRKLRLKAKDRGYPRDMRARLFTLDLLARGYKPYDIARVRGVSQAAVYRMVNRLVRDSLVVKKYRTSRHVRYHVPDAVFPQQGWKEPTAWGVVNGRKKKETRPTTIRKIAVKELFP